MEPFLQKGVPKEKNMQIIIVGGGSVGISLVGQLQNEGHDITVIDTDARVIEQISNTYDVIGYVGNGATFDVLRSVGIENCDLLIATADSDELNLLCCLAAHKLGAKNTIARVRNPEYAGQLYELKNDFGLSMTINPERATAAEIARVLRFPSATGVEIFARGSAELVSCRVPSGNVLVGMRLAELFSKLGITVLICAAERGGEVFIPGGNFVINEGDNLYITGSPRDVAKAFKKAGLYSNPVKSVMITGAGTITHYLAEELNGYNIDIKIIEKDKQRAEAMAKTLPKAVVLHGDASDHELLSEEGIDKTDAFVALTGLDEGNILSALYAERRDVHKVIVKVTSDNLFSMFKGKELETIVSPKLVTINEILRYVRAIDASDSDGSMLSLYKIVGGKVEVLEFEADDDMENVVNTPLSVLKLKPNVLIACIVREGKALAPKGSDCIMPGNSVLVATANQRLMNLVDILAE